MGKDTPPWDDVHRVCACRERKDGPIRTCVDYDFVGDVAERMVPVGNDRCPEASTCFERHARILRRRKRSVEVVVRDTGRRSSDNKLDHCTWPDDDDEEEEEGAVDNRIPVLAADA